MGEKTPVKLIETKHPDKRVLRRYESLVGIRDQQDKLLAHLRFYFEDEAIKSWKRKHHRKGFPFFENDFRLSPLALLSGDVGCGKTELALSVGSPLSHELGGAPISVFFTPSDIRGSGMVGELSKRITAAFNEARRLLGDGKRGILVIDEADDLATKRSQSHAHHEDRAGVNVLIKEIDRIERDKIPLAVILITNRSGALDPAVVRRSGLQLEFDRPGESALLEIFTRILEGIPHTQEEIMDLIQVSESQSPRLTFSDILRRTTREAIVGAVQKGIPFSVPVFKAALIETIPSPEIE